MNYTIKHDEIVCIFEGGVWHNFSIFYREEKIGTACLVWPDDGDCDKDETADLRWGQLIHGYGGDRVDEEKYPDFELSELEDDARKLAEDNHPQAIKKGK